MAYRNLIGADNFFETASKEELIDFLIKKINSEVKKGDGADCDLIRECSDWLDELTQDEIVFTPDELERNLEKIKAKVMSDKPIKKRKKMSVKTFMRVALIAAVIFTISILSLSSVARNKGYDSPLQYIVDNVIRILGMKDGEIIEENYISFEKYSGSSNYASIEDLLNCENINILYPIVLPDKMRITKVYQTNIDAANYVLSLYFSNPSYNFEVSNYYSTDFSLLDPTQVIKCNNFECFIIQKEESIFLALLQYNGYEYTIQSPNYDDLIVIINNMKG
ncbi:MAG: hypothetical protein IKK01_07365 [Clostridia bacterium]|nr:hypothetical protein [Clostridia bacterium]